MRVQPDNFADTFHCFGPLGSSLAIAGHEDQRVFQPSQQVRDVCQMVQLQK